MLKINKMPESRMQASLEEDVIKFKRKSSINRAEVVGVQENERCKNILIDVPALVVKDFNTGFLKESLGGHPYISIEYSDGRSEQFAFEHICMMVDVLESADGGQLAVFLRNWPDDLKEISFEISELETENV